MHGSLESLFIRRQLVHRDVLVTGVWVTDNEKRDFAEIDTANVRVAEINKGEHQRDNDSATGRRA